MTDFETRYIEQLPEVTAVSPDALTVVQEEGGPAHKIAIRQLLGRLIATDDVYETEDDINDDLDWPANTISLVYADPDPVRSGWYRKVGASGAGGWVLFQTLSTSGTGAASASYRFAWSVLEPTASLGHAAKSYGDTSLVAAFDSDGDGGFAIWRCVGADGTAAPGSISFVDDEILLTGVGNSGSRRLFQFVAGVGSVIDPRAFGYKPDGETTGQEALLNAILAVAAARNWTVKCQGVHLATATTEVYRAALEAPDLIFKEPAGGFAGALLEVRGATIGTVHHSTVRAEGNNAVPNPGIGEYEFQTPSEATGVIWGPDGQGNSQRHFSVNRLKTGVVITGNTEKHGGITIDAVGNDVAVVEEETDGGSPDSNHIRIAGAYNGMVLVTDNNTSGLYEITHEARIDQGRNLTDPTHRFYDAGLAGLGQTIPEPGIYIRSGKFHNIKINEWRGMNGRCSVFMHKDGGDGFDSGNIDGIGVHNYGIFLWANAGQRLSGKLIIQDQADGRNNYASHDSEDYPCPAVLLGRIYDPSGFEPILQRCLNTYGYQIGNPEPTLADGTVGLYPVGAAFRLAGSMSEEIDGVVYHVNPRTGFYPKNKTFLYVPIAFGSSFFMPTIEGNIVMGDGCQDNSFSIPADFLDKGYGIDDDSAAYGNHVQVRGRTKFSHIGHKPFTRVGAKTVGADSISDYGAMPGAMESERWSSGAPWAVSTAELASISSDVNWKFKRAGLTVLNTTTGNVMVATGSGYADAWKEVNSATTIVPAAHAGLAALLARMSAPPGVQSHWWFVYDRILTDWQDIWADVERFQLLGAHDAQTSLLDWKDAGNDASTNGTLTFEAGRGYTGDGASGYISSPFSPAASAATETNAWVHAHCLALGDTTNGDLVGSYTKTIRLRAAHNANNRAEIGTQAVESFTTAFSTPRSIAASVSGATMKQWDNGVLRDSMATIGITDFPADLDLLRGRDPVAELYRYSDDTLMLIAFGTNPTDDRMARMARLSDDIMFMTGAA